MARRGASGVRMWYGVMGRQEVAMDGCGSGRAGKSKVEDYGCLENVVQSQGVG